MVNGRQIPAVTAEIGSCGARWLSFPRDDGYHEVELSAVWYPIVNTKKHKMI
jgi:hypothetical protein